MLDVSRIEEKKSSNEHCATTDDSAASYLLLIPLAPLCASIYYLYEQIRWWVKTAEWQTITLHQALVNIKYIDPYFSFSFPETLGLEKVLNWFLFSSAPAAYFLLSVVLFAVFIPIYNQIEEANKKIKKESHDKLWKGWIDESKELQNKQMKKKKK